MELNAVESANSGLCDMMFHLTDAKRMLASVDKITEAGNHVNFGPNASDNDVRDLKTGRKIPFIKRNGVYVMQVNFIYGDTTISGEIIVDSGAAECVMPRHMLPNLETLQAKQGIRFAAANGGEMGNYGRKMIQFTPSTSSGFTRRV